MTPTNRYNFSNSLNNGNVTNLKVDGCKFNNCYQGVYTNTVKNILVTNSEFSGTFHNAIAVQTGNDAVNHGAVVISGNTFTDIGDRIIRFNNVGADTQITITYNTADNNSGKKAENTETREVIAAVSLAEGVTRNIHHNSWGDGATFGTGFTEETGEPCAEINGVKYISLAAALAAAESGDTVKLVQDITPTERIEVTGDKNITIDLAEKKITSTADVAIVNNGTGKLTITGNGTVDTSSSMNGENIAIWARTGSIDIENGTFINKSNKEATVYAGTSADASTPVITIKGGTFENKATGPYEYKNNLKPLTLNVQNDKPVTSIVITGGTFVGQNPGDGDDNKGGTFLAEGCITLVNNDTFTVSKTNEIPVTKATVQDYLDGKYGSINGKTLVLGGDNYGKIEFGRATAYAGSNTEYYLSGTKSTPDAIKQDIADHPNGGAGAREYVRYMSNVTLKAADGATVTINGLVAFGGQVNNTKWYSRDFVADREMPEAPAYDNNISYWIGQKWSNITFEGLTFTGGVDIEAYGNKDTLIDNVKFDNCKFNIANNADATYCIRLNVDGNIAKANNLVVTKCDFANGLTAVLTDGMPNVTVTGSTFSGLKGHAISPMMNYLPSAPGYGNITVTGNTFTNMTPAKGDRVILRMGDVGVGAVFTIQNNTATEGINLANSIKVNSLADGIAYNISGNNWGSLTANDPRLNG